MVVRAESGGCERARGAVSTREQSARVCIKFVLNVLVRTLKGHVTAGAQGYILGQRGARWAGDVSRSPGNPFRSLSSHSPYSELSRGTVKSKHEEDQLVCANEETAGGTLDGCHCCLYKIASICRWSYSQREYE